MNATLQLARDGESHRLGDDAVTHECAHTHGTVIGTSYFVSDAGVDAPYLELGRKHDVRLEFRGLAEKCQQAITFAAGGRHLVHDSAWCTDDEILDHLAEQCKVASAERHAMRGADDVHRRHLERCRGADALPDWDRRVDKQSHPVDEETALACQHNKRPHDVRGPALARLGREQHTGGGIVERDAMRRECLD